MIETVAAIVVLVDVDALDEFLDVPNLRIDERWHGHYVKHPSEPYVVLNPAPHVVAVTGVGGAGMTLSFGLAEQVVRETFGRRRPTGNRNRKSVQPRL
jgi:hypothetical protein